MKKGLTIALLMVAMVALAASASAVAPTIPQLPAVIIGDAGDVADAGTVALHLLKYENVFNLGSASVIDRTNTNPTTTAFLSVYYTVNNPATNTLKASNATSVKAPLTDAEVTALIAGSAPPAAKKINTATDLWLSLVHDAGTTAVVSAASATAAVNGATTEALAAKSSLDTQVVTLLATDIDVLVSSVTATGSFVVYSVLGAGDNYSPVDVVHDPDLAGASHGGYAYDPRTGDQVGPNANLMSAPSLTTADGVGFTGVATFTTGKTQAFSSWTNGAAGPYIPAAAMSGKIFRAQLRISGADTTPLQTPGYRVLFASTGFGHVGGFVVTTTGGASDTDSAVNYPSAGVEVTPRVYWGVPTTTNQYGDTELLATTAGDLRRYFMYFDILQTDAGDDGTIILEDLVVDRIARPGATTPVVEWGGTGNAFNAAGKNWSLSGSDQATGWGVGTGTVSASNVQIGMASGRTTVFQQINPPPDMVGLPAWQSNRLMRISYNLTVSNTATCPQIRMLVVPYVQPVSTFKIGNMLWGEALDTVSLRGWTSLAAGLGIPGSPKTAGSLVETYIWTNAAPTDSAEAALLVPDLDIDGPTATYPTATGFQAPNATVTVTNVKVEAVN